MSSSKKIIIKTIFAILFIESGITASLVALFYYNYETYATAKSGISNKISLPTKKIDFEAIKIKIVNKQINKNKIFYDGKLGKIKETFTKKKSKGRLSEIKILTFYLKKEEIKKAILINILKDKNLLDKYTYSFFYKQNDEKLEVELNKFLNFHILLGNISKENMKEYKSQWLKEYKAFIIKSTILIKQNKYTILSTLLKDLEEKYLYTFKLVDENIPNGSILLSDNVKYVLSKLLNNEYYNSLIIKASSDLNIEKNLLLTSISVEQIRNMTTSRGYAKKLIKQNKYLTNFSKFSYGLGGIKVKTARQIQLNTKYYNKKVYNKYFSQDKDLKNYEMINKLQDDYRGLLYSSSLIYNIKKRWLQAGYTLKDKPGIVITLYNIGNPLNKIPHSTPDLGGSIINIEGKKFYFGEIGYLIYFYLKYYIDGKNI